MAVPSDYDQQPQVLSCGPLRNCSAHLCRHSRHWDYGPRSPWAAPAGLPPGSDDAMDTERVLTGWTVEAEIGFELH